MDLEKLKALIGEAQMQSEIWMAKLNDYKRQYIEIMNKQPTGVDASKIIESLPGTNGTQGEK